MKLIKGLFGNEFTPNRDNPFDLRTGQMRSYGAGKVGHNAGWYNQNGEKLGWGDLTMPDLERVALHIEKDEMFITMSEQDSFWGFVRQIGSIGALCTVTPTETAPGREYVACKALYVVTRGKVVRIRSRHDKTGNGPTREEFFRTLVGRDPTDQEGDLFVVF